MRGHIVRQKCMANPKWREILEKVRIANANWRKEKTVNYLCQSAILHIKQAETLTHVTRGCDTLETLLHKIPNLSRRIVKHNIISHLFNVLRSCNRSPPHLKLIEKIILFLSFLANHDTCYAFVIF